MATSGLIMGILGLFLSVYFIIQIEREPLESIDTSPYLYFGSKTAYDQSRSKDDVLEYKPPPGCRLKQFYLLARHGTGFPSSPEIINMHKQLAEIQDEIIKHRNKTSVNVDRLKAWTFSLIPDQATALTPVGSRELQRLGIKLTDWREFLDFLDRFLRAAHRYKRRFSSIFKKSYSDRRYNFQYTSNEKTKESTREFLVGLFGDLIGNITLDHKENDDLLMSFKCSKDGLINDVEEKEIDKFLSSQIFTKILSNLSDRLNLKDCISVDAISMMYDICRYETAWKPEEGSPWCGLFEKSELQILEYLDDLTSYYRNGYGSRDYTNLAICTPLKDVMTNFLSVIGRKQYPVGLFRFTTSDTLLKFFTQLGLFWDERGLGNYSVSENRLWRTSLIDPFASNIAFVLMKCDSCKFQVLTLLQEQEIRLPACSESPCSFEEFFSNFGLIAINCNTTAVCYK